MTYILSRLLADFVLTLSYIYISYKLMNKKISIKSPKFIIVILSITIISVINCEINKKFFSTITIFCVFIISHKILFNETFEKSVASTIFYEILLTISEILYALVLIIFFNSSSDDIVNSHLGSFVTNLSMAILPLLIIRISKIKKLYSIVLKITEKIKKSQFIYYTIIIIFGLSAFPVTIYYKIDFIYLILFYLVMSIGCTTIIFISLKTQNKYNDVSDKYNIAVKSLVDLETMMNNNKVANHENKNLLLTIRAMIVSKEKNIPEFIDSVIENKYNDDEKLLLKMSSIPSGGLRATIYSEILKIKESNINYNLIVDKSIKTVDLIELDRNTVVDICKIMCVFIDNAIDEVKKLNEGNIIINLYLENGFLNIKVSNNYTDKINIDAISDIGYTTKGAGHGYGLTLVRNIIDKNEKLKNKIEISKNIFSQLLIVEYKK